MSTVLPPRVTPRRALPRPEPVARPTNEPKWFVIVYERGTGTPTCASGITSGSGLISTPNSEAVSVNGAQATSEVRRASTVTSHTPSVASARVRLSGSPVEQPATGGM